jgi:hypothetical protein
MKLAGREFPFWAVKADKRGRWKAYRFFEKSGRAVLDYNFDAVITINSYGGSWGPATWYSHASRAKGGPGAHYAKGTVQGFKELTILPSPAKQIFIKEVFKLYKGD